MLTARDAFFCQVLSGLLKKFSEKIKICGANRSLAET